jgi:hypothetical protein
MRLPLTARRCRLEPVGTAVRGRRSLLHSVRTFGRSLSPPVAAYEANDAFRDHPEKSNSGNAEPGRRNDARQLLHLSQKYPTGKTIRQERGSPFCHHCSGSGAFRHSGGVLALSPKTELLPRGRLHLTACRFLTPARNEEVTQMAVAFLIMAAVTAIVFVASMLLEDLHDSSDD